ncbi:MAG: aspartate/glutamate racemase family protein [Candidatus Saccharimonadales bacterium]
MNIGVFDSGVGGLSVAQAIEKAMPEATVIFRTDPEHFPYSSRTPAELIGFVVPVLESMVVNDGCEVIVIACNTVSTTIVNTLRKLISVPLIAMEPMVKPAAGLTKSGVIAVCATPTTLASERYQWLKSSYAPNAVVIEPDCSDWSAMIERNEVDRGMLTSRLAASLDAGADVIVLGCTHYHWIEDEIRAIAGDRAIVLQPEQAVMEQLKRVLGQLT